MSDIFRIVFERIVSACIAADLVGGKGFAADASLIAADANKCRSTPGAERRTEIDPERLTARLKTIWQRSTIRPSARPAR